MEGAVLTIEHQPNLNLADTRYLKLDLVLEMIEAVGGEEIDTTEALELAIDHCTGMKIEDLWTEKGRRRAEDELLQKTYSLTADT